MDSSYDAEHQTNHPAGTPQSQEAGRNLERFSSDCGPPAPCRVHPAYALGDWGTDVARLRAESYARACRSRAAVLCASTDAEDALALAIYAARASSEAHIRALVADCVAAIYPRLDPRRFHEITASAKGSS